MSTLIDSFLEDLEKEEKSSISKVQNTKNNPSITHQTNPSSPSIQLPESKELDHHCKILSDQKFVSLIQRVGKLGSNEEEEDDDDDWDEDVDEDFLMDCNETIVQIESSIEGLHNFSVRIYRKKFPGLEENIKDPVLYAQVARRVGNSQKIREIEFSDILPGKLILTLNITFSSSGGKQLSETELGLLKQSIDSTLILVEHKKQLLNFISSKMQRIAPNLCAIVGTKIAAQLIGLAGGLQKLSVLPSSNLILLGRDKKSLLGMSSSSVTDRFVGVIGLCDIVVNTNIEFRKKAAKVVANKCSLAIRHDLFDNETNEKGVVLRREILEWLEKIQELPPAIQEKPLPAPGEYKKRTKRGGTKEKKRKKIYEQTEVMKKANRMQFGVSQVEDFDTGHSFGLLGVESGNNKLSIKAKTKIKAKKQTKGNQTGIRSKNHFYGGMSGLSSSLTFTPVQGIELYNPAFNENENKKRKYFGSNYFKKPEPKKRKLK